MARTVSTQLLDSAADAAELLRAGKLVALPTETVYGLGVDATSSEAVQRLFEAKGRPSDNPLIVHLASVDAWSLAARELTESARLFLTAFAPGPITVVLPKLDSIVSNVSAGLDTVGLRIPNSQLALEVLRIAERPIAAPSANRSGSPSCTTWQAVVEDLDGRIDAVLKGQVSELGLESTVVDCCGDSPLLLRSGAITLEQLQTVVPTTRQLDDSTHADDRCKSPGLNHPHYQPRAKVILFETAEELSQQLAGPFKSIAIGTCANTEIDVAAVGQHGSLVLVEAFATTAQYAQGFYELLREADRRSAAVVFLELAPNSGIGVALRDRQQRAAGLKGAN
jgi:L-threonylcarbamoyladenylate synthase